ncbi:MAG: hypothetical protein M3R29_02380 [Verrucomicrobiota bacterium]|nr:hypothetical protein [Verrucomicrobiota bacterium]
MKDRQLTFSLTALALILSANVIAAKTPNFAGEFADKKFLKGRGVFQMSLEQSGKEVLVFFSAVHTDGHGAAPEADGRGKVTSKGVVEFKWKDGFQNSGNGTITRAGNDIIVSIKPTNVVDSRCMEFYGDNMRLKPAGKK